MRVLDSGMVVASGAIFSCLCNARTCHVLSLNLNLSLIKILSKIMCLEISISASVSEDFGLTKLFE
jgi:hypothetical protein